MNAIVPSVSRSGTAPFITPVIQATYTGGAPGTPTYSWSMVGPSSPVTPTAFVNPLNSSSQRVQFSGPLTNLVQYTQVVQCTITDPLGNVSSDTGNARFTRDNLGPPGA